MLDLEEDQDIYEKTLNLLREKPEYKEILKRAVREEEENLTRETYLGWQWFDCETPGAKLAQLVYKGLAKVNYSSRSSTHYLLKDRKQVEKALEYYEVMEEAIIEVEEEVEVPEDLFANIVGYGDVKTQFKKSLEVERPTHWLLVGPPASAKTTFLLELERLPRSYYALGSRASKAGLADLLITHRPRFLLVDELDRMSREDYAILLSLCETGIVAETKYRRVRRAELKTWVFASANTTKNIPSAVLSRFTVLRFPEYDEKAFTETVVAILKRREKVSPKLARYIAEEVWWTLESKDPRAAVRIARLCENKKEVDKLVEVMKKYR